MSSCGLCAAAVPLPPPAPPPAPVTVPAPPAPATTSVPVCADDEIQCPAWAGADPAAATSQCVTNPSYMLATCRLSCAQCNLATPVATPTTAPTVAAATAPPAPTTAPAISATAATCADENTQCPAWAGADPAAATSQCVTNPSYMLATCRLSCAQCTVVMASPTAAPPTAAPTGVCKDLDANCGTWATSNPAATTSQCVANPDYMKVHCPLSCSVCTA